MSGSRQKDWLLLVSLRCPGSHGTIIKFARGTEIRWLSEVLLILLMDLMTAKERQVLSLLFDAGQSKTSEAETVNWNSVFNTHDQLCKNMP